MPKKFLVAKQCRPSFGHSLLFTHRIITDYYNISQPHIVGIIITGGQKFFNAMVHQKLWWQWGSKILAGSVTQQNFFKSRTFLACGGIQWLKVY